MGHMVNRTLRDLNAEDIQRIADTYHAWRKGDAYEDVAGFCKAASVADVEKHGFVLTPGRYVGAALEHDDGTSFKERITPLFDQLATQMDEANELDKRIRNIMLRLSTPRGGEQP